MNNEHPAYSHPAVPVYAQKDSMSTQIDEKKKQALLRLLASWREEDEAEQRDTLAYLQRVLDEDRESNRKLFP